MYRWKVPARYRSKPSERTSLRTRSLGPLLTLSSLIAVSGRTRIRSVAAEIDSPDRQLTEAAAAAVAAAGLDGHLAIELVGEDRIRELNRDFRGKDEPTDVLS